MVDLVVEARIVFAAREALLTELSIQRLVPDSSSVRAAVERAVQTRNTCRFCESLPWLFNKSIPKNHIQSWSSRRAALLWGGPAHALLLLTDPCAPQRKRYLDGGVAGGVAVAALTSSV